MSPVVDRVSGASSSFSIHNHHDDHVHAHYFVSAVLDLYCCSIHDSFSGRYVSSCHDVSRLRLRCMRLSGH